MTTEVSIVIATATGQDHLARCLQAILDQEPGDYRLEVVVVIDGPNDTIRSIAVTYRDRFDAAGVPTLVDQLEKRAGRFLARLHAANLASHSQLLIVDDRTALEPGFINRLVAMDIPVVIPSISEVRSPTFISRTLNLVRARVYSGWDGRIQESYWIDGANFETTAKGTGGLWVPRDAFLSVSLDMERDAINPLFTNEDTRLLHALLDLDLPMFKSGEARLTYEPRTGLADELRHLYGRGPRFVDYYSQRGTRYFRHLVAGGVLIAMAVVAVAIWPRSLLLIAAAALAAVLLGAALLSERWSDFPRLLLGIPLAGAAFLAGVVRGLLTRLTHRRTTPAS